MKMRVPVCAFLIACAFVASAADYTIYNVVPNAVGYEKEQAARCVDLCEKTGVDLALYCLTLHPEGLPARAKVDRYLESYRKFAAALKGTNVRAAVLVQAILGHWPRADREAEPWTMAVDAKGARKRYCPLDPGFADYITYVFTAIAREKPAFIMADDDVRAYSHDAECFCPIHVKLFNARRGTSYTEAELRAAVAASKPGDADYETFLRLQREMLEEGVLRRARAAIDAVDPTIPSGVCVPGEEHYCVAPECRIFAARGQMPLLRGATGNYNERYGATRMPWMACRIGAFAEYFRDAGVEVLCEADTCPQNLWSKSGHAFFSHMAVSAFYGMRGAKTWFVNSLDANGDPYDTAYTDVLAEHRGYLDAVVRACAGTKLTGLAVPCYTNHPNRHVTESPNEFLFVQNAKSDDSLGNAAQYACVPFGVPFRLSRAFDAPDGAFLLSSAEEVDRLTDAELRQVFAGRVFVFRQAAVRLTERGLADLIGAEVRMKDGLLVTGERVVSSGKTMEYSCDLDGGVEMKPLKGAEPLSEFVYSPYVGSEEVSVVSPASVFCVNRLGGRVVTTGFCEDVFCLNRYSAVRKAWFVACTDLLYGGPDRIVCCNDQDVLVGERLCPDGSRLVMAVNLNTEPLKEIRFRTPGLNNVSVLANDGTWKPCPAVCRGGALALAVPSCFYQFQLYRFSK